jgi:hypothetical protein
LQIKLGACCFAVAEKKEINSEEINSKEIYSKSIATIKSNCDDLWLYEPIVRTVPVRLSTSFQAFRRLTFQCQIGTVI